ncbi:MAG: hypothetical protein V4550_17380 [Gemmatimonadota bacterium]
MIVATGLAQYVATTFVHHVVEGRAPDNGSASLSAYPLMHVAAHKDVLGPFVTRAPANPNIVMVIIEGLGRDFMVMARPYGGFMPFLDALSRSLYREIT